MNTDFFESIDLTRLCFLQICRKIKVSYLCGIAQTNFEIYKEESYEQLF